MSKKPIATVRHVSRNHVVIAPAVGYSIVMFNIRNGQAIEAVVTANNGSETVRLLVAAPTDDQELCIANEFCLGCDVTHIHYLEKKTNA